MFSTTATLSAVVNGTQTVAAAALPGVNFGNLVIGDSIIKDAAGTMGLVTAINNDTDITVTTISINTPTRELTQAEYDALTEAEKDNGTIYFILDSTPVLPAAPAFNYSTEEQVVGTWIDGKPLYQKTVVINNVQRNARNQLGMDISGTKHLTFVCQDTNNDRPLTEVSSGISVNVAPDNTSIYPTWDNTEYSISQMEVTIQYTKTTD